jgi:AraC-like DNA-binding protein
MQHGQTVIATWLQGVLAQFERQGLDATRLLEALGWADLAGMAPTRQMQLVQVRRLWHSACAMHRDPLLGLKVGVGMPLQAMNVVALVVMHSPDLRQALAHVERFQGLVSHSGGFRVTGRGTELSYEPAPSAVRMHAAQIDSVVAALLGLLDRCMPNGLEVEQVELPGCKGASAAQYAVMLKAPVVLNARAPRVRFSAAALKRHWVGADAALLRLALGRAEAMAQAQRRSDGLVDHVLAALSAVGHGQATCAAVARSLDLSVRTLQRRLGASRTNFRHLCDMARMSEALSLLADADIPLSQIADRLGYAEPSALSRAVRAHFGKPPSELRRELLSRPLGA